MVLPLLLCAGALVLALLTIQIPRRLVGTPSATGRFTALDGLRGYAAFCVFLQHAANWPDYLKNGVWKNPPGFFHHMGSVGVLLFFMITGFLFFGKLLGADRKPIDWLHLLVGRALRLGPLYLVAMLAMGLLVAQASGFELREDGVVLLKNTVHWLAFTIGYARDLNGVKDTNLIVAGVTWSLRYEWMFYMALPLFAVLMRRQVPLSMAVVCTAIAAQVLRTNHTGTYLLAFAAGMGTVHLVRSASWTRLACSRSAWLMAPAVLALALWAVEDVYTPQALALVSLAFALIAAGCSPLGIFTNGSARLLGECAYGIYLLHGVVLYIAYRLVLGPASAVLTPMQHVEVALACTPILVLVSYAAYRWIERPALQHTAKLTKALRRRQSAVSAG